MVIVIKYRVLISPHLHFRTYLEAVPKKARTRKMPATPEKKRKYL